ncbi:28S ribosomal protein S34 mitochondrial [Bienertia sinuspersici]
MALASRVVREKAASGLLWRLPYNLLQSINFSSTSSPSSTSSATTTNEASKNTKRRKKKNLFEVVQFLPNWGIGYHMAKSHWTNVSYEITKINLYKDGRHGKAWGLAYKDGIPAPAPKKISGVHKRCWKYIPSPMKLEGKPKVEAEAA